MPPSLNPVLSTARNALVTQKTHFPLPSMPVLAQVPRYHVNSISKSGFFQTKYLGFAGGFDVLKGSVKNLRAGYAMTFQPKHGTYVNWANDI